jgi:hypothetical protein
MQSAERQKTDPQCGHRRSRGGLCIELLKEHFGILQVDYV